MKINLIGGIFGTSGYALHTKQLFNCLNNLGYDIRLDSPKPENWVRYVNDAELHASMKPFDEEMTSIMVSTPQFWRFALAENPKHFIGFLVWEGDTIPKSWLDYVMDERIDQIWVPSKHTKEAIWNTYFDGDIPFESNIEPADELFWSKIKVVPHGVDLDLFKPIKIKKDKKFNFICNKGWRGTHWDRGGVQYLIKAFAEEFNKDEDVRLILKLNPAYITMDILNQVKESLQLPDDRAEIQIGLDNIPYENLVQFYNQGDVYVCPTRAEAFDLPSAEAMNCGLPVITTNFGGQIEHMNEECSKFIDYDLEEVTEDMMYEGVRWATPNINDLRRKMRWCFNNKNKVKDMGKKAEKFVKNFSWEKTAKIANKCLKEIKEKKKKD